MSSPNPANVDQLVEAILDALMSAVPGATENEVVSAVFTTADRLLRVCVDTPGVNIDPFRTVLADMYALLPAEVKH
jgi:hypothetical protein